MSNGAQLDDYLSAADHAARAAAAVLENAVPASVRSKSNPRDLVTEWDEHTCPN